MHVMPRPSGATTATPPIEPSAPARPPSVSQRSMADASCADAARLDTAGAPAAPVTLAGSYERCRRLHRAHGTTYYWATRLLPAVHRPHVHALYGLCRYADEIVDACDGAPAPDRAARLDRLEADLAAGLDRGHSNHPVLRAVVFTARAYELPAAAFGRFFAAMRTDLSVDGYATYAELSTYMDGSAAVIGELMLPILEPRDPAALDGARDLGIAFQLTNFLRDVAEDLDRGRVYLPQEDVHRFGAEAALAERRVTPGFVDLMRFEIDRCRALYASADLGVAYLPPASARCIRAARLLYSRILDRIEAAGYDVFSSRVRVPTWQKATTAARLALTR
jgi:phytoene synthase